MEAFIFGALVGGALVWVYYNYVKANTLTFDQALVKVEQEVKQEAVKVEEKVEEVVAKVEEKVKRPRKRAGTKST